jgi:hypothetical protein
MKKQAMGKLDSYLQQNVDRAYELGDVLGDVAAGGAALSSAAAETLLPDSEMDLLPVGKLMKGAKSMKAVKPSGIKAATAAEESIARTKGVEKLASGSDEGFTQMREAMKARGDNPLQIEEQMRRLRGMVAPVQAEKVIEKGTTKVASPAQAQAAAAARKRAEQDELEKRLQEQ